MEYYATKSANKALQATPTALGNFRIRLSHNGLVAISGLVARRQGAVGSPEGRR
jgi:hypothetical protein